jgi:CubicO group peptidase (beta-lactamase class C family)
VDPHARLFTLLEGAIAQGVFPGCVAIVSRGDAVVYHEAHGTLGEHPAFVAAGEPAKRDTIYDLASLTKVLCTTSLTAIATAEGKIALDDEIPSPWIRACPGATLGDLLEHCAGLVAHREYFTEVDPYDSSAVLEKICGTPRACAPRERAIYSDLGFMILGAWLERVFDGELDRVFADRIAYALGFDDDNLPRLGFRRLRAEVMLPSMLERRIAPTEVYDAALHGDAPPSHLKVRSGLPLAHGAVHDDNAWVMGGVAGHAGLFGDAWAVHELARAWLHATLPGLDATTRDRFWRPSGVEGSTRRLGFDGPSPDGSGATADVLDARAVGHTGYTGTSVWIDPHAEGGARIFVLLSNRVHPVRTNDAIKAFRQAFHRAAMAL